MSYRTLRVLIELRLRWSDKVIHEGVVKSNGGLWIPDTPHGRYKLEQAVELANKLYGNETHWIEERQA